MHKKNLHHNENQSNMYEKINIKIEKNYNADSINFIFFIYQEHQYLKF